MSKPRKRRRCMVEEDSKAQSEADNLMTIAVPVEEDSSSSSTCSSSFPSSFSSPSSSYTLMSGISEEGVAASRTSSPSLSPPGASSSCTAVIASPCTSQLSADPEESLGSSQAVLCSVSLSKDEMDAKVDDLMKYLLFMYLMKEPFTKAEMLSNIIKNYQEHFPEIFREASESIQLVFGIEIKEVDPAAQTYILVIALDLTYDGIMADVQGVPKTGLLIMVMSLIFMEGNCISEDMLWELLNRIGVYAGSEHFIYGEPRKLITHDFVQEGYLEYRQVPDSHPPSYEFLWGPRACAETTKMKILTFLTSISGSDPRSFPVWYAEALRDEEEQA